MRLDSSRRRHGFCSIKYTGNDITSQTNAKALMAPIAVCTQKLSMLKIMQNEHKVNKLCNQFVEDNRIVSR